MRGGHLRFTVTCTMRNSLFKIIAAKMLAAFAAAPASAIEVLIPSYFYPSGANNPWTQLNAAASQVEITAILNPASGPGTAVDANYTNAVNSLRNAGGRVVGYVSTSYSNRPIAQVKADIQKYASLYKIDGFFLDEMTNTAGAAELSYYSELYSYIRSLDADYRVVGNPGTNTQQNYLTLPTTDAVVSFESNTGYASWQPSAWTVNYAPRRFSNLPYNIADVAGMQASVTAAASKRVGYLYVTDDSGANPWDRLPTYWQAELTAIRAVTSTLATGGSGDWNDASRWTTSSIPNGVGAHAALLGATSSPATIFTNADVTLGSLVFSNTHRYVLAGAGSLSMEASVESALIDVRKGAHTINLPLILKDTTTIFVQGGAALTIADPLTIVSGASLVKRGAGTLNVTSIVTDAAAAPLLVEGGRLVLDARAEIQSLSLAPDASIDLRRATLTIRRAEPEFIRNALQRAIATDQASGLLSSSADAKHRLQYHVTADSVVVCLALTGDATGNGVVDFDDLLVVAKGFAAQGHWSDGDFSYDGQVDQLDLDLLRGNYADSSHTGNFEEDWRLARSLAPEPSLLLMLPAVASWRTRGRR